MGYCTRCGAALQPGVAFCSSCGAKVVASAQEIAPPPIAPVAPVPAIRGPSTTEQQTTVASGNAQQTAYAPPASQAPPASPTATQAQAPPPAPKNACPKCGKPVLPKIPYCLNCGAKLGAQPPAPQPVSPPTTAPAMAPAPQASTAGTCAGCGRPLAPELAFCTSCGRKVDGPAVTRVPVQPSGGAQATPGPVVQSSPPPQPALGGQMTAPPAESQAPQSTSVRPKKPWGQANYFYEQDMKAREEIKAEEQKALMKVPPDRVPFYEKIKKVDGNVTAACYLAFFPTLILLFISGFLFNPIAVLVAVIYFALELIGMRKSPSAQAVKGIEDNLPYPPIIELLKKEQAHVKTWRTIFAALLVISIITLPLSMGLTILTLISSILFIWLIKDTDREIGSLINDLGQIA